jgi:acetylornithine deacetylase/succinyl-diaminopimelate desuccinylase-like protein
MTDTASILTRADDNLPKSLDRLFDLVRIQSISTDPAYKAECRKAAEWLVAELTSLGFEASVRDTPGHPMVVAHHAAGKVGAPHVLFEGEEESGSPSLKPFLEANAQELTADYALVCDTNMWDRDTPAISAGLRGLVGEEIVITAADRDLHSGYFGGAAANPIHILSQILAGLHDETGRVTLDGFYEGVEETPTQIKAAWDTLGMTTEKFLGEIGLSIPSGEKGRSVMELTWARPTAEVNGIWGGYTGEGFKTVIAAQASAKVSFRLVGAQNPEKIRDAFRAYVTSKIPADCSVEFHKHGGSPAIQLPYDSALLNTAKSALSDEWPKPAVLIGMGGSIPIVGDFQKMLGMESLLVGFGLSDDRIHSPNEKYELQSFHKGIRSWIRILDALAV